MKRHLSYIYTVTKRPLLGRVVGRLLLFFLLLSFGEMKAQNIILRPDISYAGTPRQVEIGGLSVKGVTDYEETVLLNISGLTIGQKIEMPGQEITEAVKRYWKHGLFSRVSITADSLVDSKVYLSINLALCPRISSINYVGVKKSEREDLEAKLGMAKSMSLTKNLVDRAKILAKKYFDDKGYKNAEIEITQHDDVTGKNQLVLSGGAVVAVKSCGGAYPQGAVGSLAERVDQRLLATDAQQ